MRPTTDFRGALRRCMRGLTLVFAGFIAGLAVALTINSFAQLRVEKTKTSAWRWITTENRVPSDRALELSTGVCQYGIYNVGSWWDVGYETDNRLMPPCYSIGVRKMFLQLGKWKLGARFAYNDLGTVRTNNQTSVLQDGSVEAGEDCDTDTLRGCLGRWRGQGQARGVSAGFVLEDGPVCAWPIGCWTPSIEAGAFFYRATWTVDGYVEGATNSGELLARSPHWEKTSDGGARWSRAKGHSTSGYLGVGARRDPFFVAIRVYNFIVARSKQKHEHSLFGNAAWQVQAGVLMPF